MIIDTMPASTGRPKTPTIGIVVVAALKSRKVSVEGNNQIRIAAHHLAGQIERAVNRLFA
jgi:hypothetical protein